MDEPYRFKLPTGYDDPEGVRHRDGVMRIATIRDELAARRHPRVQGNPSYFVPMVLARVITRLGSLEDEGIDATVLEALPSTDLDYLRQLYRKINQLEPKGPDEERPIACPRCGFEFSAE